MTSQTQQLKAKPGLIARKVQSNDIPIADLACPPKLHKLFFNDLDRHAKCQITKLEEEYTYEVVPEDVLKLCPPLVDVAVFRRPMHAEFDELDALLLEDDFAVQAGSKRSQQHNRVVPWMRKTEYISTEFNRFGQTQGSENKIGYNIKKKHKLTDNLYKDKKAQVQQIERIFEKANKKVKKHYSKPGVHAVEELFILPDEDEWKHSYAQVIFDGAPLPHLKNPEEYEENAILKGISDNQGNQFVAYFCPTEQTLQLLKEDHDSEEEVEYKCNLAREFNWTITTKASRGASLDLFFFAERNGEIVYNEMETKVKLARRSNKNGVNKEDSYLKYRLRGYTPEEEAIMSRKEKKLYDAYKTGEYIPLEEDIVEEEPEEEAEAEDAEEDDEGKKKDKAASESDSGSESEAEETDKSAKSSSSSASSAEEEEG